MKFKENINKLHSELESLYGEVIVNEKFIKGVSFIEMIINEENKNLKLEFKKQDLNSDEFEWNYKSNPLENDSQVVERKSSVSNFTNDVSDIFTKNRFSSDYLEKLN
jgi:hypothetical protein